MTLNENTSWMTIITCLLAILFTVVGGVVTLVHVESLTFDDYLQRTGELALAVAALGVGRSVKKGLIRRADEPLGSSWLERWPISTFTIGIMVLIAAIAGGVMTIADPARLGFSEYLDKLNVFAFAVGLQGAGRAVRKGLEKSGPAASATAPSAPAPTGFEAHPDHPANGADLGVALPEPDAPGPGFVDPADEAALDDDLGAEQEPAPAGAATTAAADLEADDAGDDPDLPTDEEEDANPPPPEDEHTAIGDTYVLDDGELHEPGVLMPSQDGGGTR
ncbi:MAG TPA: hypothetical protein VK501_03550 [Baekduia sp.]|uniref:hypothetical protein n=1 Tax=Baekduia sp. TaxID=2600305 RepID=UPI002C608A06|nr:hypothetical protein [Baekduia sp.]HMJ32970.1 hypothetical protein [Baekduia sp.]